MKLTKVFPDPELEPVDDARVQAWDTPMIEALIECYHRWNLIGYPVADSHELWGLAVSDMRRARMFELNKDVRNLLPNWSAEVHSHGDSPGSVGYGEVVLGSDSDGFRRVLWGDTYDEEPYKKLDGRTIVFHVWYTDDNGNLDIIEFEHLDAARIACAVRYMCEKYAPKWVNVEEKTFGDPNVVRVEGSSLSDCPFYNWERSDPNEDPCPPEWAQVDCAGAIINTSGLCERHHNAQIKNVWS